MIEGHVRQDGRPASGAYVRLLDCTGECTAEVVCGPTGRFRFDAGPGTWTVRAVAAAARGARTVTAAGARTRVDLILRTLPHPAETLPAVRLRRPGP